MKKIFFISARVKTIGMDEAMHFWHAIPTF